MHRLAEFFRRNKSAINRAGRTAGRTELHSRPPPRGEGMRGGRIGSLFAVVALDKNQARRKSGADRSDPRPRPRAFETRSIFRIPVSAQRKKEIYMWAYMCVCVRVSGLNPLRRAKKEKEGEKRRERNARLRPTGRLKRVEAMRANSAMRNEWIRNLEFPRRFVGTYPVARERRDGNPTSDKGNAPDAATRGRPRL